MLGPGKALHDKPAVLQTPWMDNIAKAWETVQAQVGWL